MWASAGACLLALSWAVYHYLGAWLVELERATRPVQPKEAALYRKRWDALPEHVKTPSQILGRSTMGCEGTHSVFPACNFSCKPCYHSREANQVRVDGAHTLAEVKKQMAFLQAERGDGVHCQLIGGEVSLLEPDDHAAALEAMLAAGRIPMSFSNGDFSYEYLRAVARDPSTGRPRFRRLHLAAHFDRFMYGRSGGLKRVKTEAALDGARRELCEKFDRLKKEGWVQGYRLAHNMTVTPGNVEEVAGVVERFWDLRL